MFNMSERDSVTTFLDLRSSTALVSIESDITLVTVSSAYLILWFISIAVRLSNLHGSFYI